MVIFRPCGHNYGWIHIILGVDRLKMRMELDDRSYDIVVKKGALHRAGQLGNLRRKVLVVSDKGVPQRYVKIIQNQCKEAYPVIVPGGEGSKSPETWRQLLSRMLELGFDRGDCVAAVGGGVVGDLAGFVAAAYMRGIPFFQFPTTTLSQIDSSIGGKVAINLDGAKNVLGAFHQPSLVIADPDTLSTLPPRQWANGMAEALKTGLIGSSEVFSIMEKEDIAENYERILYLCLRYKKSIVERDETEQGDRKLLNFGHTIGHGIEAALQGKKEDERLLHGECVALGMLPMLESRSLERRVKAVMRKLNLPRKHSAPPGEVLHYIMSDKKRHGDTFTVVRVKTPGQGYLETVPTEEIRLMVEG